MATDFKSILNKTKDQIEDKKVLPAGEYLALIAGKPKGVESGQKKTPGFQFDFKLQSALDGVDPDLLEKAGGVRKKDGSPRTMSTTFWWTENTEHQLKKFINSVIGEDSWTTIAEAFDQMAGCEVVLTVAEKIGEQSEEPYNEVSRVIGYQPD